MNFTAERQTVDNSEVVRLSDAKSQTELLVCPSLGNNAYDLRVKGQRILFAPVATLAELKAKPTLAGNPLLAPWANRLDQPAFFANGRRYALNPELKNYRTDQFKQPIHGLVAYAPNWQVVSLTGGDDSATVTSRLEFWRYPDWMAQFPFAHTLEMTYRLGNGSVEVETVVENLSTESMPLSLGYHPYFTLPGSKRDDWSITIPAKEQVMLNDKLTPTGERKPFAGGKPAPLKGAQFDDVFTGLDMSVGFVLQNEPRRVVVRFGEKYPVGVVYAPPGRDFVCFEPMSGPTNAFNLQHSGKYTGLQQIAAAGRWRESYWIAWKGM